MIMILLTEAIITVGIGFNDETPCTVTVDGRDMVMCSNAHAYVSWSR